MRTVRVDEAAQHKYPEWIVLVITVDSDGCPNVMPAGWSMFTSSAPPMYAVSIGIERYTHDLMRDVPEFTVAIPGPNMAEAIRLCGTQSGRDVDKVTAASLKTEPATEIAPPLLREAVANFECRIASQLRTGDHTLFVGEIVAAHLIEDAPERLLNIGPGLYAAARPLAGFEYPFEV